MLDRSTSLGPFTGQCFWGHGAPADSKEHLLEEWLDDAFELGPGCSVVGQPLLRTTTDGVTRTKPVQRIASRLATSKCVCIPCNTTWMSVIVNKTKGILTPLVRGRAGSLSLAEQLQVALWACMKAAVADARPDSTDGGLASNSIRGSIYERREPPIDMTVRLAAFDEGQSFAIYTAFGVGVGSARQPLAQWVTTLFLGHLVVQVIGRTGTTLPSVLDQHPQGFNDGRSFSVWPPLPGSAEWPPRIVLSRDDLSDFLAEPCPQLEPILDPLYDHRTQVPLRRQLPVSEGNCVERSAY